MVIIGIRVQGSTETGCGSGMVAWLSGLMSARRPECGGFLDALRHGKACQPAMAWYPGGSGPEAMARRLLTPASFACQLLSEVVHGAALLEVSVRVEDDDCICPAD